MKRIFFLIAMFVGFALSGVKAADIITTPKAPEVSQWICFRKTLDIGGDVSNNTLRIAADSKANSRYSRDSSNVVPTPRTRILTM